MNTNTLMVSVTAIKRAVESHPDYREGIPIGDLVRIAFNETRRDGGAAWLLSEDEDRFRVGLVVAHTLASEKDKRRIDKEVRMIVALDAALGKGVPMNLADFDDVGENDIIGLISIFRETARSV